MTAIRDRLFRWLGAEKEKDRWHYPEYTKGCWGSPRHEMCSICKWRYVRAMIDLFNRCR